MCTPTTTVAGRPADGFIDRVDVEIDQAIGVLPVAFHLLAHRWIAEHGQRHLVELHVSRAGIRQLGDLLAIDAGEVDEEVAQAVVEASVGIARAAVEVHRRRRGQRHLQDLVRDPPQERHLVDRDRPAAAHLADHVRRGEVDLLSLIVVELEYGVVDRQPRGQLHEPAPVRATTELAVVDDLEADLFLEPHDVDDRLVLDGAELVRP